VRGVSVGGVYTTLHVPELDAVLDIGLALRSFASVGRFFLSHGHLDHVAGLAGLLNIRGLVGSGKATIHLPAEIEAPIRELLRAHTELSRAELAVELVPMLPGDERPLGHGLFVRALRTHHPVPSLGYQFVRRVARLRPEHQGKAPGEIARLRKEGADGLFEEHERLELAYATDTLSRVLESSPSLFESRVLVLECTFVDGTRTVEHARRKCHLHLDELVELAPRFHNEALVLMHFGQGTSPDRVREVVRERLPAGLRERVVVFAPEGDRWFG
jgi:ribonuclease Z